MAPLSQRSARAIACLKSYRPPPSVYSSLPLSRRAAVLLLLFADRHGDLRVVLTVRASNMNTYAGQVSLPGGKADYVSETPFQTARREAEEEIGLPRDILPAPFQVEHLCELPVHLAMTELGVRPCVAFLHTGDREGKSADIEESLIPRLNTKEVAAIFTAPFHRFLSDKGESSSSNNGAKKRMFYKGSWGTFNDRNWRMHNFYIPKIRTQRTPTDVGEETYRVFGLTAAMLVGAARTAYEETPEFEYSEVIGEEDMIKRLLKTDRLGDIKKPGSIITKEDLDAATKPSKI